MKTKSLTRAVKFLFGPIIEAFQSLQNDFNCYVCWMFEILFCMSKFVMVCFLATAQVLLPTMCTFSNCIFNFTGYRLHKIKMIKIQRYKVIGHSILTYNKAQSAKFYFALYIVDHAIFISNKPILFVFFAGVRFNSIMIVILPPSYLLLNFFSIQCRSIIFWLLIFDHIITRLTQGLFRSRVFQTHSFRHSFSKCFNTTHNIRNNRIFIRSNNNMFNIRVSQELNIQTGHTLWFLDNNRGFNSSNIICGQLNQRRGISGFTYIQRLDHFHGRCLGKYLDALTQFVSACQCNYQHAK